jgi:hypothetical protein
MNVKGITKGLTAKVQLNRLEKQMRPASFSFPQALRTPKRVLVCLPGELRELTLLKQFLPEIKELFHPAAITLLSMPGMQIADIFPRKGFNVLTPSGDQVGWSGLAKKSYIAFLKDYKFDLILDLNLAASLFTSSILLNYAEALRIGRGNHLGEPYYNIEIKTRYLRDERNIYRSLLETLKLLKDGRPHEDNAQPAVDSTEERREGVSKET